MQMGLIHSNPAGDSFAVDVAPTVSLKSVGLASIVVFPKGGGRDHASAFPCLIPCSPLTAVDAIELDREPTGFHGVAFYKSPTVTLPERDLNSNAMRWNSRKSLEPVPVMARKNCAWTQSTDGVTGQTRAEAEALKDQNTTIRCQ